MSLNKVMLIGNAGKDPDVRHLESGVSTASFSLATTERYRDRNGEMKEQTEWHNIVCWRNLADVAERFVRKGTQLYIEGKIRTRSYSDKDNNLKYITEIVADSLQLLGKKTDNPATQGYQGYSSPAPESPIAARAASAPESKPYIPEITDDIEGDDLAF